MSTREIPRDEWITFFDDFSRHHEGWIVEVGILGQDLGDQEQSSRLPLVGITADVKDRENRIEIMVGGRLDANLTHIINEPKRVLFKRPEAPAHEAIEVESADGKTTLVSFRHIDPDQTDRQLPR